MAPAWKLPVAFLALVCLVGCGEEAPPTRAPATVIAGVSRYTTDLATWQARAVDVAHGVLAGARLERLPARTPLLPLRHSKQDLDGYSVENVAFESLPGVFVTGNLYRPLGRSGPFPLLLQLHGHFHDPHYYARSLPDNQACAGHLAQMGAIVLAIDLVGYGDFTQLPHALPFVMALEIWDDVRAIDYLISLPDGDPSRVGAFGVSGGGLQAVLLALADPRVAAIAPVAMISASYDGQDPDEIGMPIRAATGTNNTEIAATLAPRPQLFVSDGGDWTREFPAVDFPYLQAVYRLYDAAPLVENQHLPDEGHDLGPNKRAVVYAFFAARLGLAPLPLDADGNPNPEGIAAQPQSRLRVFDDDHPRPGWAVTEPAAVERLLFGP